MRAKKGGRRGSLALAGVSLIELMIVIAVIGILAGITIPNYTRLRDRERAKGCYVAVKTVVLAQEMFYKDVGSYATSLSKLNNYQLPNLGMAGNNSFYLLTNKLTAPINRNGCNTVSILSADNGNWLANAVPMGKYGSEGCTFQFNITNHRANWNVISCGGADALTKRDFSALN